ncbi:hypothetical protein SMITH_192 [Smithella sp. ME-1]|nr:hypothetical protein SMITH_192 [Smithella sp. ME-1]
MIIQHKFTPDLNLMGKRITLIAQGTRRAGLINVVSEVEARAIKYAPVRTSNLANSGTSDVNADGTIGVVKFTARYAGYVHKGTGLYGPHKTKIVPKNKKALYWPGAAHPVRAVKGMHGNPFLTRAAEESDIRKLFIEGAENYLRRRG